MKEWKQVWLYSIYYFNILVLYILLCVEGTTFGSDVTIRCCIYNFVLRLLGSSCLYCWCCRHNFWCWKLKIGAWDLILVWTSAQKLVYTTSMLYPWIWREETLRIIRLYPKTNILTNQNTYHQMLKIRNWILFGGIFV